MMDILSMDEMDQMMDMLDIIELVIEAEEEAIDVDALINASINAAA